MTSETRFLAKKHQSGIKDEKPGFFLLDKIKGIKLTPIGECTPRDSRNLHLTRFLF